MKKDMKIGMFVGLVLAGAALLYVCTRPAFSPEARVLRRNNGTQSPPLPLSADSAPPPTQNRTQPAPQPQQVTGSVEIQTQPADEPNEQTALVEEVYETRRFYIVRSGDTLSKISRRYYGSPNKWDKIFDANRDLLDNPDMLKTGMKLYIPK